MCEIDVEALRQAVIRACGEAATAGSPAAMGQLVAAEQAGYQELRDMAAQLGLCENDTSVISILANS